MNDQLTKELLSRLDVLSAKLGVAANALWNVLVRQVYVEAYTDLAWAFISVLMVVGSAIGFAKFMKRFNDAKPYQGDKFMVGTIGCAMVFVGFSVALGAALTDAAQLLANPQYRALQLLLEHVN